MNNLRPTVTPDPRYFQKLLPGGIGYDPVWKFQQYFERLDE
uniref:Uncharacterized protein n=1 Tax=Serratia marcescens TaxID=615 RepID=A0A1C3HH40_SERMA|nr:Uncharacterised protein [Serratia marcescens]